MYIGEGLTLMVFMKLSEQHLKELGFKMGDRVLLLEWLTCQRQLEDQSQLPALHSATITVTIIIVIVWVARGLQCHCKFRTVL